MRHGESTNNLLMQIGREAYNLKRTKDPDLSPKGMLECEQVGQYLQQFEIDEVYTSALKRAIISGQQLIKGYGKDVPLKLILEIHERGGCHDGTTVHPGLSLDDVKALAPNMDING